MTFCASSKFGVYVVITFAMYRSWIPEYRKSTDSMTPASRMVPNDNAIMKIILSFFSGFMAIAMILLYKKY
jgi:hypothetical protein